MSANRETLQKGRRKQKQYIDRIVMVTSADMQKINYVYYFFLLKNRIRMFITLKYPTLMSYWCITCLDVPSKMKIKLNAQQKNHK